jgi:hypothetical protein
MYDYGRLGRLAAAVLIAALVVTGVPVRASASGSDGLQTAGEQFRQGDYTTALAVLSETAKALDASPDRSRLASVYLWMGAAYAMLGEAPLAEAKFRQALQLQPGIAFSPGTMPATVEKALEQARRSQDSLIALRDRSRGKTWLVAPILLGAAGAAGGVVLARSARPSSERNNHAPTGGFVVSPPGAALAGVTAMTFAATGTDADGDSLAFLWSFGDGNGSGSTVTHVFANAYADSNLPVELTVSDGLASFKTTQTVRVRSVIGSWRSASPAFHNMQSFTIGSYWVGAAGSASFKIESPDFWEDSNGYVLDPRAVDFAAQLRLRDAACVLSFVGQLDAALDSMSGTLSCSPDWGGCGSCGGQSMPVTFARQ